MPSPSHSRGRWSVAIACAVALAASRDAHADKFDRTLDFSIHGRGTLTGARAVGLRSVGDSPDDFADARLVGRGVAVAPVMRANLSLDGWRFGVGLGVGGYRGAELRYRSHSAASFTRARAWHVPIEAFVGYAFRTGERVRPFIEARGAVTFLGARASEMRLRGHAFGVAARAGILVQLNEYFFVDVGIGRAFVGPGTWTACVGLGIPIPLSNL